MRRSLGTIMKKPAKVALCLVCHSLPWILGSGFPPPHPPLCLVFPLPQHLARVSLCWGYHTPPWTCCPFCPPPDCQCENHAFPKLATVPCPDKIAARPLPSSQGSPQLARPPSPP